MAGGALAESWGSIAGAVVGAAIGLAFVYFLFKVVWPVVRNRGQRRLDRELDDEFDSESLGGAAPVTSSGRDQGSNKNQSATTEKTR